jgi:hypothetical protein
VGIYTAYAAAKIAATGCESATRTTVTVTINDLPGAPSAGNVIACFDGVAHTAVRQRVLVRAWFGTTLRLAAM